MRVEVSQKGKSAHVTLIDTMCAERLSSLGSPDHQDYYGIQAEHIPEELTAYPQWVCWRYVARGHGRKPAKQPVNPRNLANAGVQWANTWTTFDEAYATYRQYRNQRLHGIGFVLTPNDPYVAIDLDACVYEGEIGNEAIQIIERAGSYTEVSPSGAGIRILLACPAFPMNGRRGAIEIYAQSRYVTITGQHIVGTPPEIAVIPPDLLTSLLSQPVAESQLPTPEPPKPGYLTVTGQDVWECIFAHDRFGAHHLRRFQGDLSLDGGDHSLTVIRLLNCLARWTQCDAVQMRQLMLLSPLANAKWFEKRGAGDWLDYQIADAISYVAGRKRHV